MKPKRNIYTINILTEAKAGLKKCRMGKDAAKEIVERLKLEIETAVREAETSCLRRGRKTVDTIDVLNYYDRKR